MTAAAAWAAAQALSLAGPPAHAGEMSEADRMQRCANNLARYRPLMAEYAQVQLQVLGDEELARTRADVAAIRAMARQVADIPDNTIVPAPGGARQALLDKLQQMAVRYGISSCDRFAAPGYCAVSVEGLVWERIRIDQQARARIRQLAVEVAPYATNLNALRCDLPARPQQAGAAGGCQGFDGTWDSGGFKVTMRGGAGSYVYNGISSTLSGAVQGSRLVGTYQQPGYPNPRFVSGRFEFALAADGRSFSGSYTDKDGAPYGAWNGTCVAE